jgi:hypothetical protein
VDASADAGEDVQVDAAGVQLVLQEHEEFPHGPGYPVGLVDDQGVADLEPAQGLAELRAIAAGAGGLHDDLPAVRGGERVELGLVLLGASGDPGLAAPHAVVIHGHGRHRPIVPQTSRYGCRDTRFPD